MFKANFIVDEILFEKRTGVRFNSEKGKFFRRIAINNLNSIHIDSYESSVPKKELSHRLKGIVSTCGLQDAAYICKKCEQYDGLLKQSRAGEILRHISQKTIIILQLKESN